MVILSLTGWYKLQASKLFRSKFNWTIKKLYIVYVQAALTKYNQNEKMVHLSIVGNMVLEENKETEMPSIHYTA